MTSARRRELADLIDGFTAVDAMEADHRARMIDLCRQPRDVLARDHFDPGHFTASAFVVAPDGRRLLLIHHRRLRRWLQPGGHIEPGDVGVLAAARREVREETGVSDLRLVALPFDLDVHAIPPAKGEPGHLHFDVRALFVAGSAQAVVGDGVTAVRWVPFDDVASIDSDASVMRAVGRLRAALR